MVINMISEEELRINGDIILRMVNENGFDFDFIVGLDQPFGEIRALHGQKLRLPDNKQPEFFYNGKIIDDEDTPMELGMEWDDMVAVRVIDRPAACAKSKENEGSENRIVHQICALTLVKSGSENDISKEAKKKKKKKKKKRKKKAKKGLTEPEKKSDNVKSNFVNDEYIDANSELNKNVELIEENGPDSEHSQEDNSEDSAEMEHRNWLALMYKLKPQIGGGDPKRFPNDQADIIPTDEPNKKRLRSAREPKCKLLKLKDVKYANRLIEEDSTGHDYETIFNDCFGEDVTFIRIVEPWLIGSYQISNFKYFCAVAAIECKNLKRIKLVTRDVPDYNEYFKYEIEKIKYRNNVKLDIEFLKNLHDREIVFDNRWTVKIGRGLDIYKRLSPREKYPFNASYIGYEQRRCKFTTVDYYYLKEN